MCVTLDSPPPPHTLSLSGLPLAHLLPFRVLCYSHPPSAGYIHIRTYMERLRLRDGPWITWGPSTV